MESSSFLLLLEEDLDFSTSISQLLSRSFLLYYPQLQRLASALAFDFDSLGSSNDPTTIDICSRFDRALSSWNITFPCWQILA